jgi:hypothetical protein
MTESVTIIDQQNVVITDGTTGTVIVTGLLGPAGSAGVTQLSQLTDVNVTQLVDESLLVYATGTQKWIATTQVITVTQTLTLNTGDWQDTGINGNTVLNGSTLLQTGSYYVQLFVNDVAAGGTNNNEYYSGIMSWYSGETNSSLSMPSDEIPLHRAGAGADGALYLRTYRTQLADPLNLKLQIFSNVSSNTAVNYVFKFKRIM